MNNSRNKIENYQQDFAKRMEQAMQLLIGAQEDARTLARANQELSSKLQNQQEALIASRNQAQVMVADLTERNAQLQHKLLQLQFELEQYYLANCEMQAVMVRSTHAIHQARNALTKTLLND